ncbi:hypothetical protein OUZ56_001264 [Daphnia magna]|uniref:Uncharacterized protein n=1 Tax=Daphnia magna TaxID=35525 RepID=A0ABR0A2T1_9CRUS|nr:hypothetical protein OUZ56_001264 [Daphnia magna]
MRAMSAANIRLHKANIQLQPIHSAIAAHERTSVFADANNRSCSMFPFNLLLTKGLSNLTKGNGAILAHHHHRVTMR